MTYDPNIPQATDEPSQSQPQILTNFNQANALFGANHNPFDFVTVADRGKHTNVLFTQQAGDPATGLTEVAVYNKVIGGNNRLFFRQDNNGNVFQLTGTTPVVGNPGRTFLAGGLLMQWNTANVNPGVNTINFPIPFSAPVLSVMVTGFDPAVIIETPFVVTGSLTANSFDVENGNVGAVGIMYLAIGPLS